jgi:hypothetical protein
VRVTVGESVSNILVPRARLNPVAATPEAHHGMCRAPSPVTIVGGVFGNLPGFLSRFRILCTRCFHEPLLRPYTGLVPNVGDRSLVLLPRVSSLSFPAVPEQVVLLVRSISDQLGFVVRVKSCDHLSPARTHLTKGSGRKLPQAQAEGSVAPQGGA